MTLQYSQGGTYGRKGGQRGAASLFTTLPVSSLTVFLCASVTLEICYSLFSKDNFSYYSHCTQNLIIMMSAQIPALKSISGEETINVPSSDSHPQGDGFRCLDTSPNFLYSNFCNTRGLRSNFQSVQHQLSSKSHLLFLTETQVCGY